MVKFDIFGFLPYFLEYTDSMSEKFGGAAKFASIKIRPKYEDDKGILEHEKIHVKQWYVVSFLILIFGLIPIFIFDFLYYIPALIIVSFCLHGWLYSYVDIYRLWAEIFAYREQLKWYPDDRTEKFAQFIVDDYALGEKYTYEKCLSALKEY